MELMEKQGLKQTELGLIPEDWKLSILNDLTDITRLAGLNTLLYGKKQQMEKLLLLEALILDRTRLLKETLKIFQIAYQKG